MGRLIVARGSKIIHKYLRFKGSTYFTIRDFTMSSVNCKAMENLKNNPYFEKYAERISELQRTSPEEFLRRVQHTTSDLSQHHEKSSAHRIPTADVYTRQYSSVLNPKEALKDNSTVEDKKLNAIFKLELVKDKNAMEIKNIWEEYHSKKDVISATISQDLYLVIRENMKLYPTFLFPLPRAQGYEFMLCQSNGHTVHLTPLLAFQVHKENAPECLTMVHYTELEEKGIVLMRGEYDKNVLNGQEAQCLANQFQMYYSGKDKDKLQLLENFTKKPDSFKHMDLITQLENIHLI